LSLMIHNCNPSYLEDKGRRITVWGQPRKNCKTLSKKQTKRKKTVGMAQLAVCCASPEPQKIKKYWKFQEKHRVTSKGKLRIIAGLSAETLKVRRAWTDVFQALKKNNSHPRLLYPAVTL
jgi:hypothetical protein